MGVGWGGKKKNPKNLQKRKHKNKNAFSWVTAVRVLSLPVSHSPLHLLRIPSNTLLISWPAIRAVKILICSYSCVFLPPVSTAIRTSAFSFVGGLNDLLYLPQTQNSWSCGFNLQLVQMVGGFGVFFSHTAPGFQLWFYLHLFMWVVHWGCFWGCPGGLGFVPVRVRCGGGAAAWVSGVLSAPGTWELAARAAGNIVL